MNWINLISRMLQPFSLAVLSKCLWDLQHPSLLWIAFFNSWSDVKVTETALHFNKYEHNLSFLEENLDLDINCFNKYVWSEKPCFMQLPKMLLGFFWVHFFWVCKQKSYRYGRELLNTKKQFTVEGTNKRTYISAGCLNL